MTDAGPSAAAGPTRYRVGRDHPSAPVDEVWPLIGEARRWRDWSFLTRTGLEREGEPDPDGVGAVRRFTRFGSGPGRRWWPGSRPTTSPTAS